MYCRVLLGTLGAGNCSPLHNTRCFADLHLNGPGQVRQDTKLINSWKLE